MPGSKEIRTKIKSVKNTQKITRAMEMVAASKMKRAQQRMRTARPYGEKIREVCAHMARANPEYRHPFLICAGAGQKRGRHHCHFGQGTLRRLEYECPATRRRARAHVGK